MRHHEELKTSGIAFLDIGTSGGVDGARHGACFMVGGDAEVFARIEPLLLDLAVPEGVVYAGPAGAGHFVKLVHNAIEFGMVQAIGEGLDLLVRSDYPLDLPALFHNWNHGSVIRSWLVELMERGLREQTLEELSGYVGGYARSEMGRRIRPGKGGMDSRDRPVRTGLLPLSRSRERGGQGGRVTPPRFWLTSTPQDAGPQLKSNLDVLAANAVSLQHVIQGCWGRKPDRGPRPWISPR